MGAGTNIQDRLCAIHHLDAPWRPADLEQRDRRGLWLACLILVGGLYFLLARAIFYKGLKRYESMGM